MNEKSKLVKGISIHTSGVQLIVSQVRPPWQHAPSYPGGGQTPQAGGHAEAVANGAAQKAWAVARNNALGSGPGSPRRVVVLTSMTKRSFAAVTAGSSAATETAARQRRVEERILGVEEASARRRERAILHMRRWLAKVLFRQSRDVVELIFAEAFDWAGAPRARRGGSPRNNQGDLAAFDMPDYRVVTQR